MEQKANSFPFAFLGNAVGAKGTACPEDFYEYKGFRKFSSNLSFKGGCPIYNHHPFCIREAGKHRFAGSRPGSDFDIYILTAKVEENLKNGWILKENLKTSPGGFFEKIAKQDWTFAKKRVS